MANRRRQTEQFSMSFLDCMCCGFGAVILLFMIINSQIKQQNDQDQLISLDEVSSIRSQLLEERKNLVLAKSRLSRAENEEQTISDEITKLLILLNQIKAELEKNEIDLLTNYLPQMISEEDIKNIVKVVNCFLFPQCIQKQGSNLIAMTSHHGSPAPGSAKTTSAKSFVKSP